MVDGSELAVWLYRQQHRHPLTHQRFQILAWYCFGFVLAQTGEAIHGVCFTARQWPWCDNLSQKYADLRSEVNVACAALPPEIEAICRDVVTVYGFMDTQRLKWQVETEAPFQAAKPHLSTEAVRVHFDRLLNGPYTPPSYLFDAGSFGLDGAPVLPYRSLSSFAKLLLEVV